jgi:hypothetical protein
MVDSPTSAADNDFAAYVPKTAFLFPGQGAQTVGMAKVSHLPWCRPPTRGAPTQHTSRLHVTQHAQQRSRWLQRVGGCASQGLF